MQIHCRTFNISLSHDHRNRDDETAVNAFMQSVHVTKVYASIVDNNQPYWSVLVFYSDEIPTDEAAQVQFDAQHSPVEVEDNIALTPQEAVIYDALRQWRNERARVDGLAPYIIAHNRMLKEIVRSGISAKHDLLHIRGFGNRKVEKYGDDIIDVLRQFYDRS